MARENILMELYVRVIKFQQMKNRVRMRDCSDQVPNALFVSSNNSRSQRNKSRTGYQHRQTDGKLKENVRLISNDTNLCIR